MEDKKKNGSWEPQSLQSAIDEFMSKKARQFSQFAQKTGSSARPVVGGYVKYVKTFQSVKMAKYAGYFEISSARGMAQIAVR